MNTPAEQLYQLPEPIQESLALLIREVIGMSATEKLTCLEVFNWCAENFVIVAGREYQDVLRMLAAVGDLLAEAERQANPHEKEMVL